MAERTLKTLGSPFSTTWGSRLLPTHTPILSIHSGITTVFRTPPSTSQSTAPCLPESLPALPLDLQTLERATLLSPLETSHENRRGGADRPTEPEWHPDTLHPVQGMQVCAPPTGQQTLHGSLAAVPMPLDSTTTQVIMELALQPAWLVSPRPHPQLPKEKHLQQSAARLRTPLAKKDSKRIKPIRG